MWGTADSLDEHRVGDRRRGREHRVGHRRCAREHRLGHDRSGYEDDVTWASNGDEDTPLYDDPDAPPVVIDSHEFDEVQEQPESPLPIGGGL